MQWRHGVHHHNILLFSPSPYGVNIFSFLGSIRSIISSFLLDLCSGVVYSIGTSKESNTISTGSSSRGLFAKVFDYCFLIWYRCFYGWTWGPCLCIWCFQSVCLQYLSHSRLVALKHAEEKFFTNFESFSSHFVCISRFSLVWYEFVKHWLDLPCKHYLCWRHGRWSILIRSHSINLQKLLYGFISRSISRFPKSSLKGIDETFCLTITSWKIRSDHDTRIIK